MQSESKSQFGVRVTNFDQSVTRNHIKHVFSSFGTIVKCYFPGHLEPVPFAVIYFETKAQQENVLKSFNIHNQFNWTVEKYYYRKSSKPAITNDSYSNDSAALNKEEDDMDATVEISTDYVDVYGREITVYQCNDGEILIPLREIRQTGFTIFKKELFDPFLIKTEQVNKEFHMHLLSEAKKFCLRNKTHVTEEVILDTMKRCEEIVLNKCVENGNKTNKTITKANSISPNRTVLGGNNNIHVTINNNHQKKPYTKPNFSVDLAIPSTSRNPPKNNQNSIQNTQNKTAQKDLTMRPPRDLPKAIKPTEESSNGIVVQTKKPQAVLKQIKTTELEVGTEYDVEFIIKQKPNYYYGQCKNRIDEEMLGSILITLNSEEKSAFVDTEPVKGKFCVAQFEGLWYRAVVLNIKPEIEVLFIDYGNTAVVDSIKELPTELYDVPIQAFLFKVEKDLKLNNLYRITCLNKNTDGSFDISLQSDSNATKVFFNDPEPLCEITDKIKILIVDFDETCFYVRTKECLDRLNGLKKYIDNLDKKPVESVEIGQMVLCSKECLVVRAKVIKVQNKAITLKYIDFTGEEILSLNSLRNVDATIANEPCLLLKTPEFKLLKTIKNDKMNEYLNNLITTLAKLTVSLNDDHFDLEVVDPKKGNQKLSVILSDFENSSDSSAEEIVDTNEIVENKNKALLQLSKLKSKKQDRTFLKDMKQLDVELGIGDFAVYSFESLDSITIVTMDERDYLMQIINVDLPDSEPYCAEVDEVCMALFSADADPAWYRGVVLGKIDNNYQIMFIDFGNTDVVDVSNIRKLPDELKDIPVLGIFAELNNIPKNPKVLAVLKEKLADGEPVTVDIKKLNPNGKYLIEIPSAYEALRAKGLL